MLFDMGGLRGEDLTPVASPVLLLSRFPAGRGGRVRLALEVTEDGPWIDPEVARRLRAVAAVALEDLEHVAPLELLLRLLEREDRALRLLGEVEVLGGEQGLVAEHERLLDAVLELPDVAGPGALLDAGQSLRGEPLHVRRELLGVLLEQG